MLNQSNLLNFQDLFLSDPVLSGSGGALIGIDMEGTMKTAPEWEKGRAVCMKAFATARATDNTGKGNGDN